MDERLESQHAAEPLRPSEAEVVEAIFAVEHATQQTSADGGAVSFQSAELPARATSPATAALYFSLVAAVVFSLAWAAHSIAKSPFAGRSNGNALQSTTDPTVQNKAEALLGRVAAGDSTAATEVLELASSWQGKTETTPKTGQLITASLNQNDLHARAAALQAQLALNDIPRDANGFAMLEQYAGNPQQRAFAMWMLGALGNRGVDPAHAAKIISAYLNDPDVSVRSNAVIGLALLGTDETIPTLLDRFRNDPSVTVQELAGCGLAQSGMYTHAQRMVAAATLVGWLDDSLLSAQQRAWVAQALHDISGQNLGTDSAAWQRWYQSR